MPMSSGVFSFGCRFLWHSEIPGRGLAMRRGFPLPSLSLHVPRNANRTIFARANGPSMRKLPS